MATYTSSTFDTSKSSLFYNIQIITNSQSITNNTTSVTVKVNVWKSNDTASWGSGKVTCTIDGDTFYSDITTSQKFTTDKITVFQKTVNIGHNSDGAKTLSVSASMTHSVFDADKHTYTKTLPTIPRASNFTIPSSCYLNESFNITISRKSTAFTHKITYTCGSASGTVASNVGAGSSATSISYSWNPPDSLGKQFPNTTSKTCTIKVQTYNGSTAIGSAVSKNITFKIPTTIDPSNSISITNENKYLGYYLQGLSSVTLTGNWTNKSTYDSYGGSVTSYIYVNGSNKAKFTTTSSSYELNLENSGTYSYYIKSIDSRDKSISSSTQTISVQPYSIPQCTITAQRWGESGLDEVDGTKCKIDIVLKTSVLPSTATSIGDNLNSQSISISMKNDTSSAITIPLSSLSKTTAIQSGKLVTTYSGIITNSTTQDTNKSYNISVTYGDSAKTGLVASDTVMSSTVLVDFNGSGKGIAFGKVSDGDIFDVNMDARFRKNLCVFTDNVDYGVLHRGNTNKTLWTGSWSTGTITVPDFDKYELFQIQMEGQGTKILAIKHGVNFRGIGGMSTATPTIINFQFNATVSGNDLTLVACNNCRPLDDSYSVTNMTITAIKGIL